jgi:hypothetical protein
MDELPMLYQTAQPNSVLWLAVRAVAFADMKNQSAGNVPFSVKARQYYGAALNRMRTMVSNPEELGSDHVLLAMLLIDNFEVRSTKFILNTVTNQFDNIVDVFGSK